MKSNQERSRLKYLEYKLLEEVNSGASVDLKNKKVTNLSSGKEAIPTIFKIVEVLLKKNLISNEGKITKKGENYLKTYPTPKVKYEPLTKMSAKEVEYLQKLNDSKFEWTNSKYLAKKSSLLFKMVRYGYACGKRSGESIRLNKNEIVPTPSLTLSTTRTRYYFKITKKGKDFLNSLS